MSPLVPAPPRRAQACVCARRLCRVVHRRDRHRVHVRLAAEGLRFAQGLVRRGLVLAGRVVRVRRRLHGRAQSRDHAALGDPVALLDRDLGTDAGGGRRHVHRRLLGLERDQRRLERDRVAGLDEHVDDFDVLEIAEIGNDVDAARRALTAPPPAGPRASASCLPRNVVKRTAAAPSITRWSYESENGRIRRGTNCRPCTPAAARSATRRGSRLPAR